MAARFGSKKAPAAGRRNKSTRTIETYVLRVAQFAKHFGLSRLVEARLLPRRCLAAGAQSSYLFVAEQRTQLAANEPTAFSVRIYAQHASFARQADAAASAWQLYDEPSVYGQGVFED